MLRSTLSAVPLDVVRGAPELFEGSKGRCVESMPAGGAETERLQELL